MRVPENFSLEHIYPSERKDYILSSSSVKTIAQRYGAWKALECAINNSFSLKMEEINFINNSGKWQCDKLHFSLSHTDKALAVAVSNKPCGIDIEALARFNKKNSDSLVLEKFEKKICADDEDIYLGSPRDFIELWTKKESIYKCCGSGHFSAKSINTRQYLTLSESIVLDEEFVFSICGDDIDNNRIFLIDTDFSIIKK